MRITGIVQGVGFRPFIYNLAKRYGLGGWVLNDAHGVLLEVEGEPAAVAAFQAAVATEKPPLSVITALTTEERSPQGEREFVIRHSEVAASHTALIAPDVATCPDCLRELFDPADYRYRYPFINCTNCGPRFTIVKDVPYDRANTTMAPFIMCPVCERQYHDPQDRRFHAQPNACARCGPHYWLVAADGTPLFGGDPLDKTRQLLAEGHIVAIKGIGGYHLACDARRQEAVAALRDRKVREDKPFAVMAGSLAEVKRLCAVSAAEEALLTSPARPIVLLAKAPGCDVAPAVAPANPWLGVMLPYAPVHWLLLGPRDVWVMTSGNISDEPIAYQDDDARRRLAGIADFFLVHNREIYRRCDDSVARVFHGAPLLVRRSRGYTPAPLFLDRPLRRILACGPELKNTFCLTKGHYAFLSGHMGDLENQATFAAYQQEIERFQRLCDITPQVVAYDLHPEYLATKYALSLPLPKVGVQHHHAHIAAVLAERQLDKPVIGVAFDGTGYGLDGCLWGGEFLLADRRDFVRAAHFRYFPLPGGAKAIREPWRQAAALLTDICGPDLAALNIPFTRRLPPSWSLLYQALARGINAPLTSAAGRLFDAAAALLDVRDCINYEGQAAVELERLAGDVPGRVLPWSVGSDGEIDMRPAFAALVKGIQCGEDRSVLAASFHETMAAVVVETVRRLRRDSGLKQVALSGGVFQNVRLLASVYDRLTAQGFEVLVPSLVPLNDGGVALGQAIVANERSNA